MKDKNICKICNFKGSLHGGMNGISRHIRKIHNISLKEYYDLYFKKENDGICKTCNKETKFIDNFQFKYREYCNQSCISKSTKLIKELNYDSEFIKKNSEFASIRIKQTLTKYYTEQNGAEKQRQHMLKVHSDKDKHNKIIKGLINFTKSEKGREIHSIIATKNAKSFHTGNMSYYNGIRMRSSWEVKFAAQLDEYNIIWEYEPKIFKILNGKRYIPDFFIKDKNCFIEIKPSYFVDDLVLSKLKFVEQQGFKTMLVTEKNWESSLQYIGGNK